MGERETSNDSRLFNEPRKTLDLFGKTEDECGIMKQNLNQSVSSADLADASDGALCDDEMPPHDGDDVAPICDEGVETSRDPDYLEERFRVDRRKLERLIQASEDEEENAEEFFKKIMNETNTHIAWPSKLKIGAKSKKDPHIKVSGHKDAVSEAKNRILAILDTKSLRVTLKMDVSHTEHSHVIGKSGHNIKRVMQETGCHIHFPDSNRNNQIEKSNQVSIAGQCEGVELARARIRELLPLVFMFEAPVTNRNQTNIDTSSAIIQNIQAHYGVNISIKAHHQTYTKTVVVRGSVCNYKAVKKAAAMVFEILTGRVGEAFGVSMLLDIATQHHLFIIGHGGANVNRIMQQTGATIHFPDPSTAAPQRRGTICITGTMSSVLLARRQLLGCLPLVLMFDLKDDIEIDQGLLNQLTEQLDVFISIKPKPKQTTKSVIVKTIESNTQNVYEARRRILGLMPEVPSAKLEIPQVSEDMADVMPELLGVSRSGSCTLAVVDCSRAPVPIESRMTPVNKALSPKNPVYRPMVLQPHPHQGTMIYPPSYPPAPVCYLPSHGPQEWSLCPPSHPMQPHQQHLPVPPFSLSPNQRSSVLNDSEHSNQHVPTTAFPLPQISAFSPSNTSVSSHNLRNVAEVGLPHHRPHPLPPSSNSAHPFVTPLSFDLMGANDFISNLSDGSAASQSRRDILGVFDPKSVLPPSELQRPFLRNHLSPSYTGLTCLQSIATSGSYASPLVFSPQPYVPETDGLHSSTFYNPQPIASATTSSASLSSFLSPVHFQPPLQQQYSVYDGILQMMPEPKNDVYQPTLKNTSLDNMTTQVGYRPPPMNGTIYMNGAKDLAPVDDERHDLLDENQQQSFPVQNGDVEKDGDCESDSSSERSNGSKAPGSNRPMRSVVVSNNSQFEGGSLLINDIDYERMKMLASKAMQKKPVGESRIPTDYWAGLGFSRSMPASAIRETLKLTNTCYEGPKMTTPYEEVEEESESWKSACGHLANPAGSPDGNSSLMDLVSKISAQCHELSLQQGGCNIRESDGCDQLGCSPSSSIWQPLSEKKQTDMVAVSDTDLSLLFCEMGLEKYLDLFKQQEIDMATFRTLTDQDLRDLGIITFGARRKMLLAIADLNKRQSVLPPPPGLPNPFRHPGMIRRHDVVSQSVRW